MALLPEITEIQDWPQAAGMVFLITDGDSAFLFPAGRVYDSTGYDFHDPIAQVISDGLVSPIVVFDAERGLYLGLPEFCRIFTLAMAEAAMQQLEDTFLEAAEHQCLLIHMDDLADFIVDYQIHASCFFPLLVELNASSVVFNNTVPEAFPDCEVLYFPMGDLEWQIGMIGKHFNLRNTTNWGRLGEAKAPILVAIPTPENGVYWFHDDLLPEYRKDFLGMANELVVGAKAPFTDFPVDWLELKEGEAPEPPSTPKVTHDFDGSPLTPENQPKMDLLIEAFGLYEKGKAGGSQEKIAAVMRMDEMVKELKRPHMEDPQEKSILAQLLNLKGLVEKDLMKVDDAIESLSWAFQLSPEGLGKQDIAYNYGYVQLMELSRREFDLGESEFIRIPDPQSGDTFTFAFPIPLWPGWDKKLLSILGTFEHAANNVYKYSQSAMIYLLLGGTGNQIPISKRIEYLETAIDFYRRGAQLAKSSDALKHMDNNRIRCQALLMQLKQESRGLFGNRKSKKVIF